MPLRSGRDVVSLLHRDVASHLLLGATPYQLFCQYMANADSPTHAREGNAHHGDAARRRFPMISHLGRMLSLVVGGAWAARRQGEDVFGLTVLGDGCSSTGEFHESLNLASVQQGSRSVSDPKQPVLFLHAHGTPISLPASFLAGKRLRRDGPNHRRPRSVGGLHLGVRSAGDDAGHVVAGGPRVHDGPDARPRGLRQSGIRAGRTDARVPGVGPAAPGSTKTDGRRRHFGKGRRGRRAGDRRRDSHGVEPGHGGRTSRSAPRPDGGFRRIAGVERQALPDAEGQERRGGRPGLGLFIGKQPARRFCSAWTWASTARRSRRARG